MKVVIQRVSKASVTINTKKVASIKNGILILLGIVPTDSEKDILWLSKKIINLRIFNDQNGVMNESLHSTNGNALVVSQFTLHALTKKGNRPSYIKAAKPTIAFPLYKKFIRQLEQDLGRNIQTGSFGANMKVELINDGPVTIIIDTEDH